MQKNIALSLFLSLSFQCFAQNEQYAENDTIETHQMKEVIVDATLQSTSATVSTYLPTSRQKTASQTAIDLLGRMGIPQIAVGIGGSVTTASGQNVSIFIDFLPASEQELSGMRMTDVKKVEYYDYPDDPRFQGAAHVINFVMQKYEFGGYVKALGKENFLSDIGQLNLYSKLQHKKMTYDIAVGSYYSNSSHDYSNTTETYRLPQLDGTIKEFQRISTANDASSQQRYVWPTFKAVYQSEKAFISNTIGANFDHYPKANSSGSVAFNPAEYERTDFINSSSNRNNSVTYEGNGNFLFPHNNSLSFLLSYSYSHTNAKTLYQESGGTPFYNGAVDDTHRADGGLRFQHRFGKYGSLSAYTELAYTSNNTTYTGTANATDKQINLRIAPGVAYSYTTDKFYGMVGGGFHYAHLKIADMKEESAQPWGNFSAQYAFNDKNSLHLAWFYVASLPAPSYRSGNVIQSNPLLSYMGNPTLTPTHGQQGSFEYTYMPSNKLSFTVFGDAWIVSNRYAYVYGADNTHILRTIQQPVSNYSRFTGGVLASLKLLQNSLQLQGRLAPFYLHDGASLKADRTGFSGYLQANYYLNNWTFGLTYLTKNTYGNDLMAGMWTKERDYYWAAIGWGNATWNFKGTIANIFRWNHRQSTSIMKSQFYDISKTTFAQDSHAFVQLSVTYTFGFGKKIQQGNEAEQQTGVSSGILK